jgi:division protein CdvB (Snf7/Vps24/ESCRT-III family)
MAALPQDLTPLLEGVKNRLNILSNNLRVKLAQYSTYERKANVFINFLISVILRLVADKDELQRRLEEAQLRGANQDEIERLQREIAELNRLIQNYSSEINVIEQLVTRIEEKINDRNFSPERDVANINGQIDQVLQRVSPSLIPEQREQLQAIIDEPAVNPGPDETIPQPNIRVGGKKAKSKRRKFRMIKCRSRKQMRGRSQKGGFIAIFDQKPSSPIGRLSAEKNKSKDKHRSKKHHHKKHENKPGLVFAKQPEKQQLQKKYKKSSTRKSSRRSSSSSADNGPYF